MPLSTLEPQMPPPAISAARRNQAHSEHEYVENKQAGRRGKPLWGRQLSLRKSLGSEVLMLWGAGVVKRIRMSSLRLRMCLNRACGQFRHVLGWREFVFHTEAGSWPATKAESMRRSGRGDPGSQSSVFKTTSTSTAFLHSPRGRPQSHEHSTTSKQVSHRH